MAMKHGMDGALGGDADVAGEALDEQFPDLPRAPMRLVLLEPYDHALDRLGQLVRIAHRPSRAVRERLEALVLIAVKDLVAGLPGDTELPAQLAHAFSIEKA